MNLLELFCHVDDFCQTFKLQNQKNLYPAAKRLDTGGELSVKAQK